MLANIPTNYRQRTVFSGKPKPTAWPTTPTIAWDRRTIGIHIQHCVSDEWNSLAKSTLQKQVAQSRSTTKVAHHRYYPPTGKKVKQTTLGTLTMELVK